MHYTETIQTKRLKREEDITEERITTMNRNQPKSLAAKGTVGRKLPYVTLKRMFDIVFSLFGLIVLCPVFLCIAVLVKMEDGWTVFYRDQRVGRYGKPFKVFKFRTMVRDANKIAKPPITMENACITKIGRFLRKYKLDELPQLINVLKGEMSLVGPRPEVQCYVDLFTEEE